MSDNERVARPTVASVVAAADAELQNSAAACKGASSPCAPVAVKRVSRETILALTNSTLQDGWQEDVQADLDAQLEGGATLYGNWTDGTFVARTKSGCRRIPRSLPDDG